MAGGVITLLRYSTMGYRFHSPKDIDLRDQEYKVIEERDVTWRAELVEGDGGGPAAARGLPGLTWIWGAPVHPGCGPNFGVFLLSFVNGTKI